MERQLNSTIQRTDGERITRCEAASAPEVELAPHTYVMPGSPRARAAVDPTLVAVFSSAAVEPAAVRLAPARGALATVKSDARLGASRELRAGGAIAIVVMFGVLSGALLGIALAPARAHAEGAHAARTPTYATAAAVPTAAAAPAAQAAAPSYDPPAPTTSLAPSPRRVKEAPTPAGKKCAKNPPSPSGLVRASRPR